MLDNRFTLRDLDGLYSSDNGFRKGGSGPENGPETGIRRENLNLLMEGTWFCDENCGRKALRADFGRLKRFPIEARRGGRTGTGGCGKLFERATVDPAGAEVSNSDGELYRSEQTRALIQGT
jgi:hypothetical protein